MKRLPQFNDIGGCKMTTGEQKVPNPRNGSANETNEWERRAKLIDDLQLSLVRQKAINKKLLEALKRTCSTLNLSDQDQEHPAVQKALKIARAAIAKAEGGAQ